VFITELDVNDDAVATTNITERNKIVANAYGSYLTAVLERPQVKAVLTWGVSDKNSWLSNGTTFRKQHPERLQRPLPFDPDYLPVPAFFAIRTSFEKTMNR
jgi:endo-1,4-beta-xylanase